MLLADASINRRKKVHKYFQKTSGISNVVFPQFKMLYDFMREHTKPTLEVKEKLLAKMKGG